ncbi:MAG: hypothetical protein Q9221_002671 [Calogaya cf. arnoldii]
MADPSSDPCKFQDKIHVLSLLTAAQQKSVPHKTRAERYVHCLNGIATLIATKVDNGQDAATTYFRFRDYVQIVWALGGNATRSNSHQTAEAVNDYLDQLQFLLFDDDGLLMVLYHIVSECRPAILRHFQEVVRCIARESSHPVQAKMPYSTKARTWSQEIQMLVRETEHYVVRGKWSNSAREERAANYGLFIQKISNTGDRTSDSEFTDLIVYCYFLSTSFGETAPMSKRLHAVFEAAGDLWGICKDLRQQVVSTKRSSWDLWVDFEQLPTPPPQAVTHHISPLTALKVATKDDGIFAFGGYTLLANLSTYTHIPLAKALREKSTTDATTTSTSVPHPELLIANHLLNNYTTSAFRSERDFPIGASSHVCHWCSKYFESIRMLLRNDLPASGPYRSDKDIVVSQIDHWRRDSTWVLPAESPKMAVYGMEMFADGEIEKTVKWT